VKRLPPPKREPTGKKKKKPTHKEKVFIATVILDMPARKKEGLEGEEKSSSRQANSSGKHRKEETRGSECDGLKESIKGK